MCTAPAEKAAKGLLTSPGPSSVKAGTSMSKLLLGAWLQLTHHCSVRPLASLHEGHVCMGQ